MTLSQDTQEVDLVFRDIMEGSSEDEQQSNPGDNHEGVPSHDTRVSSAPAQLPPSSKAEHAPSPRTRFEDLFVADPLSPPARAGVDEKLTFFRAKLKRTEEQLSRAREAWNLRETEFDALEVSLEQQKDQNEALRQEIDRIRSLMQQQQKKISEYGDKAIQAVSQRDEALRSQHNEIQHLRRVNDLSEQAVRVSDESFEKLKESILVLNATTDRLHNTIDAREAEIAELREALKAQEEDRERMVRALRAERAKVLKLEEDLKGARYHPKRSTNRARKR